MSVKEERRRRIAKAVFKEAWSFQRRNVLLTFKSCLKFAWGTVRSHTRVYHSKVRGVSFGKGQKILKKLCFYNPKEVVMFFLRDYLNENDPNAVEIYIGVVNKGAVMLGYLSKEFAAKTAPLMDEGREIGVFFEKITGIGSREGIFGCNFSFVIK